MKKLKKTGVIVLALLLLTPFMASSALGTVAFTGKVVLSDGITAAAVATVEMAGNPSLSTVTATDGIFTLSGLPIDTPFSLKISMGGYADTYSAMIRSDADIDSLGISFVLFTPAEVSAMSVTAGKGVITGRVWDETSNTAIDGAVVSCTSMMEQTYTIVYPVGGTNVTLAEGKYMILNVEDGDMVSVTVQKAGLAFDGRVFMTHADSVSEGWIFGTTDADKLAIHTQLQAAIDKYNAEDLVGFMGYVSGSYLDDGMDKAAFNTEVAGEIGVEQLSYVILNTTVDGNMATTYVIWSYGETETLHFIKEGETWMLYGNQKKYGVEARSQNWNNGQQYWVHFEVEDPNHTADSVTITGPGILDTLTLDYYDANEGSWNSWQSTEGSLNFGATPPTPLPLTYEFTVVYPLGEPTEVFNDIYTIQSFVSVLATDLSTSGAGTTADPLVFSWTGVGPGYTYQVQLSDADGNRIWDSDWGLTTTSVSYDGDSLTPDAQYIYWVVVADQYGNESFAEGSFTYQAAQPGQTVTGNVTYSVGSQTGYIKIKLWSADLTSEEEFETTLTDPGAFTIDNVPDGRYYACAFRDSNNDGNYTDGEAYGYWQDGNGLALINLTGTGASEINIALADPATTLTGASVAITSNLADSLPGYLIFFRSGYSLATNSVPVFVSEVTIDSGFHDFQVDCMDDPYEDLPVPAGIYDFYFMTGDLSYGPDKGVIQGRQTDITISRGAIISLDPITFNTGGTVSGTVTSNSTYNSLRNVDVYLILDDFTTIVAWGETDENGNFQFEHVPVGTYYLDLSFSGYAYNPISVNVTTDVPLVEILADSTRLTPSQTPGTISGILTPFGAEVDSRVKLKNNEGETVAIVAPLETGAYTVTDVVPGISYTLIGLARGYVPQPISVTVNAEEEKIQNFNLDSTKDVVVNGLTWLLDHQRTDGSFDDNLTGDTDQFVFGWTGYTGLALLSIYENPKYNAGGSDELDAELLIQIHDALYGDTKNGIKQYFELTYQATNDLDTGWDDIGAFFDSTTKWASVAATPVALEKLIALGVPLNDPRVVGAVQFLLNAQVTAGKAIHPVFAGGWRYNPDDTDTDNWETSWVIMALMKAGVNPTTEAVTNGLDHIKRSQVAAGENAGLFLYQPGNDSSGAPLGTSAACILALNFAGELNTEAHVASFFNWVKANPNFDGFERWADAYWWSMFPLAAILYDDPANSGKKYYDTLGLTWSMANYIILSQQSDGRWDNPNYVLGGSRSGNSVMHTASALMAIAPYEYLTPVPEQVTVSGLVSDHTGQPLQDAKVEALLGGNVIYSDTTVADGFYELSVPTGYDYTIVGSAAGYARSSIVTGEVSGDLSDQNVSFTSDDIDNAPPTISSLTPANNDTVFESRHEISAILGDDHAGIDPDTIVFKLDGTQVNASYNEIDGKVSFIPNEDLANGSYTVTVDVKDYAQNPATQADWFFIVAVEMPGDINNDGSVNLADAILALQVVAGFSPDGVNLNADVNGDGWIGLAEVIYILQYVAGFRQ